jgi:hypothetical protein
MKLAAALTIGLPLAYHRLRRTSMAKVTRQGPPPAPEHILKPPADWWIRREVDPQLAAWAMLRILGR